jgi:hypothetical protein
MRRLHLITVTAAAVMAVATITPAAVAQSQPPIDPIVLWVDPICPVPGGGIRMEWHAINTALADLTIVDATQMVTIRTGPTSQPVAFTPNPISWPSPNNLATGITVIYGSIAGSITLTVHWSTFDDGHPVSGEASTSVPGFECGTFVPEDPAPTTTPTTTPAPQPKATVAPAVATTPAFTG